MQSGFTILLSTLINKYFHTRIVDIKGYRRRKFLQIEEIIILIYKVFIVGIYIYNNIMYHYPNQRIFKKH